VRPTTPSHGGGGDGGHYSPSNRSQFGGAGVDGAGVGAEVARAIYAVTEERAIALGYKSRTDLQVRILQPSFSHNLTRANFRSILPFVTALAAASCVGGDCARNAVP
jgi:hypothetical protein